jgi:hypothetical protein
MPRLFGKLQLVCAEVNLHLQCGLLGARRRQLHSVCSRKLQDVVRRRPVHGLSNKLLLAVGELNFVELRMQRRTHAFWTGVRTVPGRNFQGVAGISPMQLMLRKHVFDRCWGIGMPRLFARLQLVCAEDNLHLQCGLLGARRRQLHSVRSRKLQDVDRISSVHALPTELYLVSGELNSDELHMQRSIHGDDYGRWRGLRGVRGRQIQGVDRIGPMQPMQRTHVFDRCWGISGFDLSPLFARLQVSSRELNLHL